MLGSVVILHLFRIDYVFRTADFNFFRPVKGNQIVIR